ncbi:hypothetical protein C2G38_2228707 [Gigaspora rosea]|uniref:BACK domain-containing protein n=1 Tax=Gigaspora rosea TaxID=44941 RepID=A0A397U3X3_9GLOM|nr:hypothetical protein C2G38_2228707 [Gigaspora rosea]
MNTKFFEKLSSNLSELLINGDEYNVVIEVDKLNAIVSENGVKTIKDIDISVKVFEIIIKYIYDGTISLEKVDVSVIFDLLIGSNEFGLEELVKHIQSLLIGNNASWLRLNFSRVYQASFKDNNFDALLNFCTNIIAKYPNIVFDSDEFNTLSENILVNILKLDNLQMDEGLIWDYVIRWRIAQNTSLSSNPKQWSDADFLVMKNTLQNCLPLIRYFQISGQDIFKKVRPYQKILDPIMWEDIEMKFMMPDQTITSQILPPRNPSSTSLPSRSDQSLNFITDNNENEIELNNIYELGKRAKYHFKMKRYNEALEDLNKAIEIGQNNQNNVSMIDIIPILEIRGETYFMMGEYKDALSDFDEFNEVLNFEQGMLVVRGSIYFLMGRYKEALVDFNKLLEIESKKLVDSNNPSTLAIRELTYRSMDSNKLNELLKCDQNNVDMNVRLFTYFLMGQYNEALAAVTKSLEIKQDSFALMIRAEIYRIMGKYEEALADITSALEIDINSEIYVLGIRGLTYRSMGRHKEAHADLNKLNKFLEYELNYSRVLIKRGRTFHMMGRYEEALKDLTNSLEILPNNVFALVHRETYRILGRYNESLADLNKSLEICPNDVEALKAHKKLMLDMNKT